MIKHLRLLAVAAILAPLAPLSTASTAHADTTVTTAVRVATYNVQIRRSLAEFRAGVLPLLDRSDIVGLQEMDTREKDAVLASLADSGWARYAVRPSFQHAVLWRTDRFEFVSGRVAQISATAFIGNELPRMGRYLKPRYVTVVRLVDKVTGRRLSVVNAHVIQGAIRGGKPRRDRPRTFEVFKRNVASLASLAVTERRWGRVFVLGDFNAGWVADRKERRRRLPIRTLGAVGLTSMWAYSRPTNGLGTRNGSLIDGIFTNMRPISSRVQFDLSGYSDHRPAIATYPTV